MTLEREQIRQWADILDKNFYNRSFQNDPLVSAALFQDSIQLAHGKPANFSVLEFPLQGDMAIS